MSERLDWRQRIEADLEGGHVGAETLLKWFWQLQAEIGRLGIGPSWGVPDADVADWLPIEQFAEDYETYCYLDSLRHRVCHELSKCMAPQSVPLVRLTEEETKELAPARLEQARNHLEIPIVVGGTEEDETVVLLDGHHRVAVAKSEGCKTLPAVWIPPYDRTGEDS